MVCFGCQVVGQPGFPVGEAEGQGRLVAEIDPVEDVVQVALAERHDPRSPLLLAQRPFEKPARVRSAGFQAPLKLLAIAFPRFDGQNPGGAIGIADRPRALVQGHVVGHIAVEDGQRAVAGLAIGRVERRMQQHAVQIQADAIERRAAQRELRVEVVVGGDAGQALDGSQRVVGQHAGQVLAFLALQRDGRGGGHGGDSECAARNHYRVLALVHRGVRTISKFLDSPAARVNSCRTM